MGRAPILRPAMRKARSGPSAEGCRHPDPFPPLRWAHSDSDMIAAVAGFPTADSLSWTQTCLK